MGRLLLLLLLLMCELTQQIIVSELELRTSFACEERWPPQSVASCNWSNSRSISSPTFSSFRRLACQRSICTRSSTAICTSTDPIRQTVRIDRLLLVMMRGEGLSLEGLSLEELSLQPGQTFGQPSALLHGGQPSSMGGHDDSREVGGLLRGFEERAAASRARLLLSSSRRKSTSSCQVGQRARPFLGTA